MMTDSTTLLRWHVSRVPNAFDESDSDDRKILVTINQWKHQTVYPIKKLVSMEQDNLDWWDCAPDHAIQGWIAGSKLLNAIESGHYNRSKRWFVRKEIKRSLYEDMVFVQFVKEGMKYLIRRAAFSIKGTSFDPEQILDLPGSMWVDFTPQAREMSTTIYKKLLALGEEDSK